ncbi:unnamed protein product, partial [Effrenium voratum]
VLGHLASSGQLPPLLHERVAQVLGRPLSEPGWHEMPCVACAEVLCHWGVQRPKGESFRNQILRPVRELLTDLKWQDDIGLQRVRYEVSRSFSQMPRALEFWPIFMPYCAGLKNGPEDPLALAAMDVLLLAPNQHYAMMEVLDTLHHRLQMEVVFPSENHRLAAACLRCLAKLPRAARTDISFDSFLAAGPSAGVPGPARRAWAQAYAVGSAPSSLQSCNSNTGFKWSRAVRREACIASCRGSGPAVKALSRVLAQGDTEDLADQSEGALLQHAVWTAEALLTPLSEEEMGVETEATLQDLSKAWPPLAAALTAAKALQTREMELGAFQDKVMREGDEPVLWRTPGLYSKPPRQAKDIHAVVAARRSPSAKAQAKAKRAGRLRLKRKAE